MDIRTLNSLKKDFNSWTCIMPVFPYGDSGGQTFKAYGVLIRKMGADSLLDL